MPEESHSVRVRVQDQAHTHTLPHRCSGEQMRTLSLFTSLAMFANLAMDSGQLLAVAQIAPLRMHSIRCNLCLFGCVNLCAIVPLTVQCARVVSMQAKAMPASIDSPSHQQIDRPLGEVQLPPDLCALTLRQIVMNRLAVHAHTLTVTHWRDALSYCAVCGTVLLAQLTLSGNRF